MLVRAKAVCFIGGIRRRVGDVFEFSGKLGKSLEEVELKTAQSVEAVKTDTNPMGNDELRVRLGEYGVKTHPATSREKLLEKLKEAEGR